MYRPFKIVVSCALLLLVVGYAAAPTYGYTAGPDIVTEYTAAPTYGDTTGPGSVAFTCGDVEPDWLLDSPDAVGLRIYSMENLTPYWLKRSASSVYTRTKWYYDVDYKVKPSGEAWGSWENPPNDPFDIPPADWAGCQKILVIVSDIEEGDLVMFKVSRQYSTSNYAAVEDCNDGTTMTSPTDEDLEESGELGPGDSYNAYYFYQAS